MWITGTAWVGVTRLPRPRSASASATATAGWAYTPQVMLDGKDFRAWHRGLPARSNVSAQADLALTLNQTPERIEVEVESRFATPAAGRDTTLYLALFENRLSSKVTAGENAERTLHHDHVVRQLTGPLDPRRARHSFKLRPGWKAADLGVAAFVLDAQGATLQALARTGCPWFHPPCSIRAAEVSNTLLPHDLSAECCIIVGQGEFEQGARGACGACGACGGGDQALNLIWMEGRDSPHPSATCRSPAPSGWPIS